MLYNIKEKMADEMQYFKAVVATGLFGIKGRWEYYPDRRDYIEFVSYDTGIRVVHKKIVLKEGGALNIG